MSADEAGIRGIPWCAALLSDANIVVLATESREPKASTEDALFAQTLKTPDTISACLTFYRAPASAAAPVEELSTLVSLGYAVNGYPRVAHGGVVATLLDEVMGLLLTLNQKRAAVPGVGFTASLNVSYLNPVATPSTVLVSARLKDVNGRKMFLEGTVKDGSEVVLARAEALWITVDKPRERL
jgi:acyl-coenzyme A thioesterase PaaI-like protein